MLNVKEKYQMRKKQRNNELSVEQLLITNLTNTNEKLEDKMSKLKAIFQVNNYNNEKLMLNKIKEIIYE